MIYVNISNSFFPFIASDSNDGLLIKDVVFDGSADSAGLKNGDKVLSINDHTCVGIDHYQSINIMNAMCSPVVEMKICRKISTKEQPNIGNIKKDWKFGDNGFGFGYQNHSYHQRGGAQGNLSTAVANQTSTHTIKSFLEKECIDLLGALIGLLKIGLFVLFFVYFL